MNSRLNKFLANMKVAYKAGYEQAMPKWKDPKRDPPEVGEMVLASCECGEVPYLSWMEWPDSPSKIPAEVKVVEYIVIPKPKQLLRPLRTYEELFET